MMESEELVKDVVCGMVKPKSKMKTETVYKGKTYYFCSENCRSKFKTQLEQSTAQKSDGGCKCCP